MSSKILGVALSLVAGFAPVAAANRGYSSREEEPFEKSGRLKIEEGYVPTDDGTRLFYQKVGFGKETVIIPGGLFLFDDFKRLAKNRTLIFYDMRGRGRSDPIADDRKREIVSIHDDVKDVERIRQHFKINRFSLTVTPIWV